MLFQIVVGALGGLIIGSIRDMKKELRTELERLRGEVSESNTIMDGAATMIEGLSEQLRAAAGDPDAVSALADALDANQGRLSAAIANNTPAAEEEEIATDLDTPIAETPAPSEADTATGEETGTTS